MLKNQLNKKPSLIASHLVKRYFHGLEISLLKARSTYKPEEYVQNGLNFSLLVSIVLSFVAFFILRQIGTDFSWTLIFFLGSYIILFIYFLNLPSVLIMRLQRDIDKQLLFATRHMLISLDSGDTLLSSMNKIATHNYGKASQMFEEIMRDVKLGKSIEDSIDYAIEKSPSETFSKLLIEIGNSLKIGTDITISLKRIVQELTQESELGIQRYNKKMNSLTLFYLILGVVFPSIGIAMLVILSSLSNLDIQFQYLLVISFFLLIIQAMFLSLYGSLRRSITV